MPKRTKQEKDQRKQRRRKRASQYDFGCGPWVFFLELLVLVFEIVTCS